jgi:hypothetical protein
MSLLQKAYNTLILASEIQNFSDVAILFILTYHLNDFSLFSILLNNLRI